MTHTVRPSYRNYTHTLVCPSYSSTENTHVTELEQNGNVYGTVHSVQRLVNYHFIACLMPISVQAPVVQIEH